jgi:phosphoribosylformylglycinamidine (FGAM) synthase-like enzyme
MAAASDTGVTLDASDAASLFGEDQGRYLIACSTDKAEALMVAAGQVGLQITTVGKFGGDQITIGGSSESLDALRALSDGTLSRLFD